MQMKLFGLEKKSIEGVLKGMVTDPTVPIEYKGKDIININNYKRIIICSNESVPVPVGLDDRRFLLLDVSDKFKEDRKYFGSLINQMDNGGLEALMLDLINEDLSNFDVRSKPKQSNLLDLKLIHAEPHIRWWHECLFNGDLSFADLYHEPKNWENPIDKSYLYINYKEFCNNHEKTKPVPNSDFYKKMIEIHPDCKKARPTINGKRPHCIQFPPLARCRQDFEKVINNKVDWPETEQAEASLSCPSAI